MRKLIYVGAAVAALTPVVASAADYSVHPRVRYAAPRYHAVQPMVREVPLPVIGPPKPLYYVRSPAYYVQHLDEGGCGPCGSHPAPGRWHRYSGFPF